MPRWTSKSRKKQSEAIARWKPWKHSTESKTSAGKQKSSQNSFKHGLRSKDAVDMNQEINQCLNELKEFLDGLDPTSK